MFESFNEPSKYYELPVWKLKGIAPVPNGRSVFSTAQSWAAKMKGFGRSMGGGEPEFESAVDLKTLKKLIDWRVPFRFRVKRMFRWVNYEWTGEDIVGMDGGGKVERLFAARVFKRTAPIDRGADRKPGQHGMVAQTREQGNAGLGVCYSCGMYGVASAVYYCWVAKEKGHRYHR